MTVLSFVRMCYHFQRW